MDVKKLKKTVAVFGPSRCVAGDWRYDEAYRLGELLAEKDYVVMSGGRPVGVMGAVLFGCQTRGGETFGIGFSGEEQSLVKDLSRIKFAPNLPQRLSDLMAADAFISFSPQGASGTAVELLLANEVQRMELLQRNDEKLLRPVVLIVKGNDPVLRQLDFLIPSKDNFIHPATRAEEAVDYLDGFFNPKK
ncbi:MAG: hypothetical protein PHE24_06820 [Patescibacteria group bacterium]|nr:hypothetical protein [Patescibacteria group bacterium]